MCRAAHPDIRRALRLGLLAAFVLGTTSHAAAQEGQPDLSRLTARLDSLREASTQANHAANVRDSIRWHEQLAGDNAIDTLQVGPFFVIASKDEARTAKKYFDHAWAGYSEIVGTAPSPLDRHLFSFLGKTDSRWRDPDLGIEDATVVDARWAPGSRESFVSKRMGVVLNQSLPEDLARWTGGFFLPSDPDQELEWTYRQLVMTRSSAVADCYHGVLTRCWDALGLDHQSEWSTSWYDADDRIAFVADRYALLEDSPQVGACVERHLDDPCLELMSSWEHDEAIPLYTTARMTLVAHALSLGGPGSFQALAGADGAIRDRLAAAARVAPDALITSWREAVIAARPPVDGGGVPSRLSSFAWLLILAAISMRSTRWRLA